ncbi:MAG: coiled-coil domain-containing protein, partial [Alphaproteobacteria bacterium]
GDLEGRAGALQTQIAELRTELRTEVAELRTEIAGVRGDLEGRAGALQTQIAELRAELRAEIASLRTDMEAHAARQLRWLVGTILAATALAVTLVEVI